LHVRETRDILREKPPCTALEMNRRA
jgi:hypothetical protein